jgi:hypothetical protein
VTLLAVPTVLTFDPFMFEIAEPCEAMSKPLTVKPVRVPTEVMLGWDGWTTELAVITVSMIAFP